jgi:hypothetical protein
MTETEFKKLLWDSANKLRGAMSAAEYKFPVLGSGVPEIRERHLRGPARSDPSPTGRSGLGSVHAGGYEGRRLRRLV